MKHLLTILLIVSFGTIHAQFINTTVTGSPSTLFKSRGGLGADSAFVILNSYPDTTTANYSIVSRYNSIIRIGSTYWFRTLSPNKWNLFTSGAVGTYMLVTDTASMLSNYYNKTVSDSKYALRTVTVAGSPISSNVTLGTLTAGGYTNGVTYNGSGAATIIPDTTKLATKTDITNKANWDIAYNGRVASLTTSGSSGSATFISNVLNVPTYTISGMGGIGVTDTATMLSSYYNKTASDSRFQPLEDQRVSTTNSVQHINGTFTGYAYASGDVYSATRLKTAGNVVFDNDSTGLMSYTGGYKFYAVQAGLNSWYTPQPITANSFVKIGGTSAQYLMADGSVSTGGTTTSGTYTPTWGSGTNISSHVMYPCQWTRVGNVVTVAGQINVTHTSATTATTFNFSLPVSSTFTATGDLSGTVTGITSTSNPSQAGVIDWTGSNAVISYNSLLASPYQIYFTFSYIVK